MGIRTKSIGEQAGRLSNTEGKRARRPFYYEGLAEFGPGGGEVDDFGGVLGVGVGVFDGVEEECANEFIAGAAVTLPSISFTFSGTP